MHPSDEEAFRDFVVGRSAALLRTAYLLTGDAGHAEDLLQTSLAKLYRSWRRLQDRENLDSYVRKIMINTRTSWWRRRWRDEHATGAVPDVAVSDAASAYADRDRLLRVLRLLPERQRAVVVLRYYDDFTEAEVARLLGCSVGTVKSQCSRGLAKMRALLDDTAREPELALKGVQ